MDERRSETCKNCKSWKRIKNPALYVECPHVFSQCSRLVVCDDLLVLAVNRPINRPGKPARTDSNFGCPYFQAFWPFRPCIEYDGHNERPGIDFKGEILFTVRATEAGTRELAEWLNDLCQREHCACKSED